MSKVNEWVASVSDNEIVDAFNHGDIRLASAIWSALSLDEDRTLQIHRRGVGRTLVGIINSKEYKDYVAHEKMVPEAFKAEFEPAETAEIGALINGSLLCIDNEDPSLPACLEDGRVRTVLNIKPAQYHWVPTQAQARGGV